MITMMRNLQVSSVMFGQNIIALRKQTEGEGHYFDQEYRFKLASIQHLVS